nr:hypothetical protein [Tanacetum cinerariifolium]
MENEHELSYETLTRVYLGSYEYYKSVGAGVEPGFEFDDQEWVEIGTFRFVIEEEVRDELKGKFLSSIYSSSTLRGQGNLRIKVRTDEGDVERLYDKS